MGTVLLISGIAATAIGTWRAYAAARAAVGPLIHEGDPTRVAIDAARPLVARTRVRLFARRVAVAVAWLLVASYGLLLASVGAASS